MILCDVNVLVYACAPKSPGHSRFRSLLVQLLGSGDRFGVYGPILSGVLRICTHPKIFRPPATADSVYPFLERLREHPRTVHLQPGPGHWDLFRDLVIRLGLSGGDVADAWFAALAIEQDCEWWTTDSGFERFPGLRVRSLIAG